MVIRETEPVPNGLGTGSTSRNPSGWVVRNDFAERRGKEQETPYRNGKRTSYDRSRAYLERVGIEISDPP
jgi:hypothetical protein